jgi:Fe-S oxidoreductase
MDKFILDHTRQSPTLDRIRNSLIEGDPGAVLCVELYDESAEALLPRLDALERDLRQHQFGYRSHRALDLAEQARIWNLRESALGLSMAMKEDAKSVAFVEDTAVAPEKLRAYIERFLGIVRRHQTSAGVYAHASVGCLHVRPVVNLKTEQGIQKFESIANEVSDLVLEFGGALSGEHGDGLVRSPFMQKMFGAELYEAFRSVKRTFDPIGILNPGKIVDSPPLTANLRFGSGYRTPTPATYFDYSEYGGLGGAVEMCSGLGVCRKRREGTMCPSYMATGEEAHSTRGRANVLRLAMAGRLGEAGLGEQGVYDVLDLCLECRACKSECPVGVDVARFKSEFLADYQNRHGVPLAARLMGNLPEVARWGSRSPALANRIASSRTVRWAAERFLGIDRRRRLPYWRTGTAPAVEREADILLFHDTFTKYYEPEIATAALEVFKAAGLRAGVAPNLCCGRTLISKGLLSQARELAARNIARLVGLVRGGIRLVFCEPSCLSAMREDVPSLLRGELQQQARMVADACVSFEEALAALPLELSERRARILLHGHCHQRAMGLVPASVALLSRIPGARVVDLDAGCCGMAGSFGYSKDHYEVSRQIAERKLLPALRNREAGDIVVASGFSCRHQVSDFAAVDALHPASLIRGLLRRAV